MQQHLMVYVKLAGTTSSPRNTIFPMPLSNNELYILNISKSKQFTHQDWDSMGNEIPLNSLAAFSRQNNNSTESNHEIDNNNEDSSDINLMDTNSIEPGVSSLINPYG